MSAIVNQILLAYISTLAHAVATDMPRLSFVIISPSESKISLVATLFGTKNLA